MNRARQLFQHVGRHKPGRARAATFEPLGTRHALSAGGIAPFVFELNAAPSVFDAPAAETRSLSFGGEFTTLEQNPWRAPDAVVAQPVAAGRLFVGDVSYSSPLPGAVSPLTLPTSIDMLRKSVGPEWRPQDISLGASELDRPTLFLNAGYANHRIADTRVAHANVQVSGTNYVLPGLLVSRGDALTLLVSASPIFGLPGGSQNYVQVEGRPPLGGERIWTPKGPIEVAFPSSAPTHDDRDGDRLPGTTIANPGPSGIFTLPPRMGDLPFASSTVEPRVADVRATGGWAAGIRTELGDSGTTGPDGRGNSELDGRGNSELDGRGNSAPAPPAPLTGQWAISKTELDEGLIELGRTLTPRQKGRKLAGEPVEDAEAPADNWASLQAFAEQVWLAWRDAWAEFGRDTVDPGEAAPESQAITSSTNADAPVGRFNAEVMEGLVELVVSGGVLSDAPPRHSGQHLTGEHLAEDTTPVRIDAGVAIFQQFEIANGVDATSPTTARTAERNDEGGERADAETTAERQPISAAAIGAGLIIGLPFSVRRSRQNEDAQRPRLRKP